MPAIDRVDGLISAIGGGAIPPEVRVTSRIAHCRTACRIWLGCATHALTVWPACCVRGLIFIRTCITRACVLLRKSIDYVLCLLWRFLGAAEKSAGARAHQKWCVNAGNSWMSSHVRLIRQGRKLADWHLKRQGKASEMLLGTITAIWERA